MKISKYTLKIINEQSIRMPVGSIVLSVANQFDKLCVWALVDDTVPVSELKHFEVVGTGNPIINDEHKRRFIGTVLINPFVWHVFEKVVK